VGDFLQRLEIIPAVALLTGGFVKISICLLASTRGVSKLFNCEEYRFLVTPVGLLMLNLAYLVYDNIVEMMAGIAEVWTFYAFPFQVILPLIIWVGAEITVHRGKQKNGSI
jgi:spore germination protein KB